MKIQKYFIFYLSVPKLADKPLQVFLQGPSAGFNPDFLKISGGNEWKAEKFDGRKAPKNGEKVGIRVIRVFLARPTLKPGCL